MFTKSFILTALVAASASAAPLKRACDSPAVNDATLELIKEFEGFVESPSPDPIGLPTVGYGHLCQTEGCSEVEFDFPLSEEEATELLATDVVRYQDGVADVLGSDAVLNDNQYGALVSWCFNVGPGAVADSTLVSRLNDGEDVDTVLEEELPKWVYADGEVFEGLVRRRNAEIKLGQTSSDTPALPAEC
ncbi:hypothetical protein FQN54_002622 [Arachnomyces sp. PD_36]|nr:hypothetical protein FQN54_002622 [Arachnomyces sp. PD_36]